jgi:two-component system LytT family response regulator
MLKVVIIEDEILTANRLEKLLLRLNQQVVVLAKLGSINEAVKWIENNPMPQLFFMDIQIADGLSFEIFKKVNITVPVIFTTAYDHYAIDAFKVEGLDYLLKPIEEKDLQQSLDRFYKKQQKTNFNIEDILQHIPKPNEYRNRFLVSFRDTLQSILIEDIAYFVSEFKTSYLITNTNKKFNVDNSLEELEQQLNPAIFLRISRQIITKADSIKNIATSFNGKLKITLSPNYQEEILISREKALQLKEWLNK